MLLKIRQAGEAVLRRPARTLTPDEILSAAIQRLIADMGETMRDAPGVGLAAPQIGEPVQLAVIEDRPEYFLNLSAREIAGHGRREVSFQVIINPVLSLIGDETTDFFEGCLSIPGFTASVARQRLVAVRCLDENAQPKIIEASDWHARILQHEIDHLFGILFTDRMDPRTFMTNANYLRYCRGKAGTEGK